MTRVAALSRDVWCVDVTTAHNLARETPADRAELGSGGAARLFRRRLLRAELAQRWTVHPDALRFHRAPSGQVRVTAPRTAYLSAAQRGDMIALAVSEAPIGVDIEPLKAVAASEIEGLCPSWAGLDPTARWTAFEALGKLLSVGTAVPVGEIVTRATTIDELRLSVKGREIRIALFSYNRHQIAVAGFDL